MALKYASDKRGRDRYGNSTLRKVRIKFDRIMLQMFIGYLAVESAYITRAQYINLKKLLEIIDMDMYSKDAELYNLICFAKLMADARVTQQMTNLSVILSYCLRNENESFKKIADNVSKYANIKDKEVKWINKAVADRLKYAFILWYKAILYKDFERLDTGDFESFEEVCEVVKAHATQMLSEMRRTSTHFGEMEFSLAPDIFESAVTDIVNKLKDKSRRFTTGLRALNRILSPGFLSGRLYLFLARTANFKSGLLLSIAKWFKDYNYEVKPKRNPDATPTVLLITTENSIAETVARLFAMICPGEDIEDLTPARVIDILRKKGGMKISVENRIDIRIIYRNDREIDTSDIYGIIEDIENENCEVIALILDYIKRIRATESGHGDERIELKNCSSELKNLAENLDIPVITAMQINRAGNSIVEMAMGQSKEDLAKYMGSTNVANCWDLIENADWVCIINIEKKKDTGQYFLTFKRTKIRYGDKAEGMTYFNQPFGDGNKIRLLEDVLLPKSLAITSLSTGLGADDSGKETKKRKKAASRMEPLSEQELAKFAAAEDPFAIAA